VHATVLDLLGVFDRRAAMPFASQLTGRSLLREPPPEEPSVLLSTASGVWEPDDPKYGVMRGDVLAVRTEASSWWCYDIHADPREQAPRLGIPACEPLVELGTRRFASVFK
jgi:hypothetical protein